MPEQSLTSTALSMLFLVGFFALLLVAVPHLYEIRDRVRAAWRDLTRELP